MEKMPWSVVMINGQLEDLESRIQLLSGCRENLTAPMLRVGSILRPSLIGSIKNTIKTPTTVTVDYFKASTAIIGLEFPEYSSEFIGRPVFGHDGASKLRSTFGDEETTDTGFKRIESISNSSGESIMVGYKEYCGPKILTGLTYEELTGFVVGCISAVEKCRNRS